MQRFKSVMWIVREGDNISFNLHGEIKYGKILKIYTKIGFEDHGKEFVVISLSDSRLRFYEGEIELMKRDLRIIK